MVDSYEFDEDTRLTDVGGGRYGAEVSKRWNVGPIPNGGYVMALAFKALDAALPHPDMLSLSAHFVAPAQPGPAELLTEPVHAGKGTSCAAMRFVQEGKERARFMATAGHFEDPRTGLDDHSEAGGPAALPPLEQCTRLEPVRGVTPRIGGRFESHHPPETHAWRRGELGGPLRSAAWIRFADGRPPDLASLALFPDALAPTLFSRYGPANWVPTLQMNVQFRRRPAPGFIRLGLHTRHLSGGLHEEDGELWDSEDRIVALSRQLARVRMA